MPSVRVLCAIGSDKDAIAERRAMGRVSDSIGRMGDFVNDVHVELKKSAWPNRAELVGSTAVIIVSVLLLGAFVGASDKVLEVLIRILLKR